MNAYTLYYTGRASVAQGKQYDTITQAQAAARRHAGRVLQWTRPAQGYWVAPSGTMTYEIIIERRT